MKTLILRSLNRHDPVKVFISTVPYVVLFSAYCLLSLSLFFSFQSGPFNLVSIFAGKYDISNTIQHHMYCMKGWNKCSIKGNPCVCRTSSYRHDPIPSNFRPDPALYIIIKCINSTTDLSTSSQRSTLPFELFQEDMMKEKEEEQKSQRTQIDTIYEIISIRSWQKSR